MKSNFIVDFKTLCTEKREREDRQHVCDDVKLSQKSMFLPLEKSTDITAVIR